MYDRVAGLCEVTATSHGNAIHITGGESSGGFPMEMAVLSKVENPGSPNGPSTVERWVICVTFGWSVYDVARNDKETTISYL